MEEHHNSFGGRMTKTPPGEEWCYVFRPENNRLHTFHFTWSSLDSTGVNRREFGSINLKI